MMHVESGRSTCDDQTRLPFLLALSNMMSVTHYSEYVCIGWYNSDDASSLAVAQAIQTGLPFLLALSNMMSVTHYSEYVCMCMVLWEYFLIDDAHIRGRSHSHQ
jgi:hypothetical protein